jgi:hypothetical protein
VADLGLGVEIRSVEHGDEVTHRVIAGPFRDPAGFTAAREKLAANQFEAKPVDE